MANYVYTMNRVGKIVPPKRQILKDISLSFFPGAKIGVLGLNGSGKSTLLKIMAGIDTDIQGEARPMPGLNIGYLPQEPQLDPEKTVRQEVESGLGEAFEAQAKLEAVYAAYAEEDADFDALLEEPVQHLRHGLRRRRPLLRQPGGPHRALDLRPARHDPYAAQPGQQLIPEPPAVRGLDPAPEPDRGRGDDDVRRLLDDLLRRGQQLAVVGERHDPQGGGVQDGGTASLQQHPELIGPARGRHTHGETRQGSVVRSLFFLVHGSRPASSRRTSWVRRTYMPIEPVNGS